MTLVEAGFRAGTEEFPDDYELKEWAFRGGEGDVWLATTPRLDGETRHRWALKILSAEHLVANHHESAAEALQRWHLRTLGAMREVNQLDIPGVVGASTVFIGAPPHRPGEAGASRTLYVVSKWIDGVNLPAWIKRGDRTFVDVCGVAEQLAQVIDAITGRPLGILHRDISPANVMVENGSGEVKLIDFTFAVPVRSGPGTIVVNPGYTAPEARGGAGSAAADRYSFGAVVYYLFLGQPPPEHDAGNGCRAALRRANFPAAVADHVSALLATEAQDRPVSLLDWARELRVLASSFDTATGAPAWGDLDITIDGTNTALVLAVGTTDIASTRLAAGALWSLVPDEREHAPRTPVGVRAACDGAGNPVQFVVNRSEALWVGRSDGWTREGGASLAGGIAAVRTTNGSALAYTVDPVAGRLTTVEARLDGKVLRSNGGPHVRRVLAAAVDANGRPTAVVTTPEGALAVTAAGDSVPVGAADVSVADLCLNPWGELKCLCAKAGTQEIRAFEQLYGRWTETKPIGTPGAVSAVACAGRRGGITVAFAGDDGLWVAHERDGDVSRWHRLTDEPCDRVVLGVGAAWRLRLAALVGGSVAVAAEDTSGSWSSGLKKL